MPDKIKRGRKEPRTLEDRVLRDWSKMKRPDSLAHWSRKRTGKTVHMMLAERYKVPCQTILDIIDPDRKRQAGRIARHNSWLAYTVRSLNMYPRCAVCERPIELIIGPEITPGEGDTDDWWVHAAHPADSHDAVRMTIEHLREMGRL